MQNQTQFDHNDYLSPLTWRYGSTEMRRLWSEQHKRLLWRRIWLALAAAQHELGLISAAQLADIEAHVDQVDLAQAQQLEAQISHDLVAELRVFAGQCPIGGGVLHLGATSMDIEDNADVLRIADALGLLRQRIEPLLRAFADQVERWAATPTMGFTHLQPAEPTTIGHRLAQYAQDLLDDYRWLIALNASLRGKGLRGAVGTSASYGQLLGDPGRCADLEQRVLRRLGIAATLVSTQTYPRKQDFHVLSALAALGQSLHRFALDLRLLQSPLSGEWAEPFGRHQVGSSAMPFKRNPIQSEKIDSLARLLAALPRVAWDNAAHTLLERTLDDSANRRSILPEAFLICDELLITAQRLISELQVDVDAAARLLERFGSFAGTERVLVEATRRGGDRQALHELLRQHALAAWDDVRAGRPAGLATRLAGDARLTALLTPAELNSLLDASQHLGDAAARARALAAEVRAALAGAREAS